VKYATAQIGKPYEWGRRGINAPKGISDEIPRPPNSPGGELSVVYAGLLTQPLVSRVNLPDGKFLGFLFWTLIRIFFLAEKCIFDDSKGRCRCLTCGVVS
ncbi:hypothetical protein ABZZ47_39390, partial [Streptomyces sp. NPDC006465]|uniref:hypothetical protein n=1 Tax=Streptomyces sp. NPDC006465 TaxID=3157174 RepID=UPI0033AEFE94